MGGNRPMTVGRAVSLAAVVAVVLGAATGLSHVGHSTTSSCKGDWWVVVANTDNPYDAAAANTRASRAATAPLSCPSSVRNPKGGWLAYYQFRTQQDAQSYAAALIAAGYAEESAFTPYVMQALAKPAP